MLDAALGLKGSIDTGSRRSCRASVDFIQTSFLASSPAAAAASDPAVFLPSAGVLEFVPLEIGLRLRLDSACFAEGDLDRRSKREVLLGSGSV